MSDDDVIEYVVSHTGHSRRKFLMGLLAGSAFAMPVVASFAIGGGSSPKRRPLDAGSNQIDCGPNMMWDEASNMCVDAGSNQIDCGPNMMWDEASNMCVDDGTNQGSGAGELPASK